MARESIHMVSVLEVENLPAKAVTKINDKLIAVRKVALQNRMLLDFIQAAKGGTFFDQGWNVARRFQITPKTFPTWLLTSTRKQRKQVAFSLPLWSWALWSPL